MPICRKTGNSSFVRPLAGTILGVASVALLMSMAPMAPASAQSGDAALAAEPVDGDGRKFETIYTTARKKTESLQEVPVTVTAIGGATVERFNIDEVADIAAQVPTLNVQIGGSGSGAQVSLRGVGSSNITAAFDSAVALDFDGVQVSSMRVLQSGFFDVRQIEVLKGPQSLFFGKSASAGVISIKSANPTEEFEIGAKASYEFEERGYIFETYVSGPITPELGFRLAAKYNDISRQYINQSLDPMTERKKGQENVNIRATLQWDPADNFAANLKLNYVGHENDGAVQDAVLDCGANGVADVVTLGGGSINIPAGYECDHDRKRQWRFNGAPPLVVGGAADKESGYEGGTSLNGGAPFGKSEIWYGRLRMDWNVTDDITLTSVTGYLDQSAQDNDWYSYGGFCATPGDCPFYNPANPAFAAFGYTLPPADNLSFAAGGGITDHQLEQFTQELRMSTNYDAPVNFMLGVFYEDRHIEFNTNQYAVNLAFLAGPDLTTGFTSDWLKRHLYDNRAVSVFGQVNWDITDRLELAGGVRWSDERKRNNIVVPYMHFLGEALGFAPTGFDTGDIIFKDSNLSPEATLTYAVTDTINVYVAYKTGFKSGGIDNSALPSANLVTIASDDPVLRQAAIDTIVYDSETAKGGEFGVKSLLFDETLQLNFTAYYYVFKDLQVQNFDAVAIQFQTSNASELTNKGLELDFNWLTPVEGLTIFGSLALTSTKFTDIFDPNPNNADDTENLQGRKAARAPTWAGNVAFDYRRPVGNGLEFGLNGNLQFSSKYFADEGGFDDTVQSGYVAIDAAVSLGGIDGGWELAFIGRNITDKRAITTAGDRPFLIGGVGDDQVWNLIRGRQLFIEASFKY